MVIFVLRLDVEATIKPLRVWDKSASAFESKNAWTVTEPILLAAKFELSGILRKISIDSFKKIISGK